MINPNYNSLPEQVQENKNDIEQLKANSNLEPYRFIQTQLKSTTAVPINMTNIFTENFVPRQIIDPIGNVFFAKSVMNGIVNVDYIYSSNINTPYVYKQTLSYQLLPTHTESTPFVTYLTMDISKLNACDHVIVSYVAQNITEEIPLRSYTDYINYTDNVRIDSLLAGSNYLGIYKGDTTIPVRLLIDSVTSESVTWKLTAWNTDVFTYDCVICRIGVIYDRLDDF